MNTTNPNAVWPMQGRSGYVDSPNIRGTMDIVWSCFSALFICLWSMLHLNIPARGDTRTVKFWRRSRWLLLGVLGPEVPMLIACGQWASAKRSVKEMRELGHADWTIVHGFYADMGGFIIVAPDSDPFPVSAKQIAYLVRHHYIPMPTITKEEIWDKGNADVLAKGLAFVQTGWLTMQVIARGIEHLPITLLELGSLSLSLCSLTTLWFWLKKPLDVSIPTRIFMDVPTSTILRDAGLEPASLTPVDEVIPIQSEKPYDNEQQFHTIVNMPSFATMSTIISTPTLSTTNSTAMFSLDKEPGLASPLVCQDTPLHFIEPGAYMSSKCGPTILNLILRLGLQRRPINRIPDDRDPHLDSFMQVFILGLATAAFASIHLAGWNFSFATSWEALLYRTCCCGIWGLLGAYGTTEAVIAWHEGFSKQYLDRAGGFKLRWPRCLWFHVPATLYVLCRIGVVIEALWSLHSLPNGAFVTVDWTGVLPHI